MKYLYILYPILMYRFQIWKNFSQIPRNIFIDKKMLTSLKQIEEEQRLKQLVAINSYNSYEQNLKYFKNLIKSPSIFITSIPPSPSREEFPFRFRYADEYCS